MTTEFSRLFLGHADAVVRLERRASVFLVAFFVATLGMLAGCGPVTSQDVRWARSPASTDEYKQTKDGITVELQDVDTSDPAHMPPSLVVSVPRTGPNGQPEEGQADQIPITGKGQVWVQVAITNNTEHVVRLNQVVIKLFDPAGNQTDPFSKGDLPTMIMGSNLPPNAVAQVMQQLQLVKLIDRNVEILPNTTVSGFLAFKPPSVEIPGIWKLAIYEVPVDTDDAGKVTKTTRFELRTNVQKFVDTYRQDSPFAPKVKVGSAEVKN